MRSESSGMPDVEGDAGISWLRRTATYVGISSLILVVASYGLLFVALAAGVHCPQCDQQALGARYYFWQDYFSVMHATFIVGVVVATISVGAAHMRRYAVIAICLAILFLGLMPR